jgi:septum formation protein
MRTRRVDSPETIEPGPGGGGGSAAETGLTPARRDPRSVPILLASRSARRAQLLAEHGYTFRVLEAGVDDGTLTGPSTRESGDARRWVTALAYLKAFAAARTARHDPSVHGIVLGADTVCVLDGDIVGQPKDAAAARRMIASFEGRAHDVVTGVALVCPRTRKRAMFADRATVTMGRLDPESVDEYLSTDLWKGKAGAYNLFERILAGWPIEYVGDPTTVVGLPMRLLAVYLPKFAEACGHRASGAGPTGAQGAGPGEGGK